MEHFLRCFDYVVAFYMENYAARAAEKRQQQQQQQQQSPQQGTLQFHLEPMEIDQSTTAASSASSSNSSTAKVFDEDLAAVEQTLAWYATRLKFELK